MQVTNYQEKTRFHIWPWYVSPQKRRLGADLLELCFYKPTVNITACIPWSRSQFALEINRTCFFCTWRVAGSEGTFLQSWCACSNSLVLSCQWLNHASHPGTNKQEDTTKYILQIQHSLSEACQSSPLTAPRRPRSYWDVNKLAQLLTPSVLISLNKIFHSLSSPLKIIAT